MKQLSVSCDQAFRVWKLLPGLKIAAAVLGLGLLALLAVLHSLWWTKQVFTLSLGMIATVGLVAIAGRVFGPTLMRLMLYRKTFSEVAIGVGMCLLVFLAARIHLAIFDKLFLRQGCIGRVVGSPTPAAAQPPPPPASEPPKARPAAVGQG